MTGPSPYRPTIPAEYWQQIGPFVEAAVTDSAGATSYSERELFAAVTPFVLWAWQAAGLPLERRQVFQLSVIDRFTSTEAPTYRTDASRNTIRSRLLRMAEVLHPDQAPRDLRPLGASDPTRPYSPEEIAALRSWARSQRTEQRRRDAEALLALGLGAGLSGREILHVRITDIRGASRGVDVVVGGERPRRVPVLREWERALLERADGPAKEAWAFRAGHTTDNANLITDFVSRSRGRIQLQARRMRTTWIVHHLNVGTPAVALIRAAGVNSLAALDRFLPFADITDEFNDSLRGTTSRETHEW
jgi:integrase